MLMLLGFSYLWVKYILFIFADPCHFIAYFITNQIMKKIIVFTGLLFAFFSVSAQVGIGTITPDASSILEISTTDQGILIPRMTEVQRDAITSPATSLLIYQTDNITGYYYYTGSAWVLFSGIEKIDDLTDGKSDSDGSQDGSSIFLGINAGAGDDGVDSKSIGVGFEALSNNWMGIENTAIGYQSMKANVDVGDNNSAFGIYTLYNNEEGDNNTAMGSEVLYSNAWGSDNTGIGYQSLYSNVAGNSNVAVGFSSLYTNDDGDNNIGIGFHSLFSNVSGDENIAIGYNSLWSNIGDFNIAIGSEALSGNSNGVKNTAIGYNALSSGNGDNNTALGYLALSNLASVNNFNVAIGSLALPYLRDGWANTSIGSESGPVGLDDGSYNVFLGYRSGYLAGSGSPGNVSLSNSVFLGAYSGYNETNDNRLHISTTNTNTPLIYGEFDTGILRIWGKLQIKNPANDGYEFPSIDGAANQVLQTDGLGALTWVDSTVLGDDDHDWYEEGGATPPDDIADNMYTQGNVAIGKTTATYRLDIEETSGSRGINASISGSSNGSIYGSHISNLNTGTGTHFGIYTSLSGTGIGAQYGSYKVISNSGNNTHYGSFNSINGSGSGIQIGSNQSISNSGTGNHYGVLNFLSGSGSGIKYGTYNNILNTAGGTHYGIYSNVLKAGSYAGYFLGNVSIGTTTTNNYLLPVSRGTNGQMMQTDGSGNLSWVTQTGDISSVTAGDGLIGGGTSAAITIDVEATNGLTDNADDIRLGGSLVENTTISQGAYGMTFNLTGTGDFKIQDAGITHFEVRDPGQTYFGDDTYWMDGSTTGTTIAKLYDNVDDGVFDLYSNGSIQHSLNTVGTTVFNEQGIAVDFRIESISLQNLFFIDAGDNKIGVNESLPTAMLHIKQYGASEEGFAIENDGNTNTWSWEVGTNDLNLAFNGANVGYWDDATGNYVATSDSRLKKDIKEIKKSILPNLLQLKPVTYHLLHTKSNDVKNMGFIAQDVQKYFPEIVYEQENGYLSLHYPDFGVLAIKAIQEQQKEIEDLKQQLKIQQKEIDAIKAMLSKQ